MKNNNKVIALIFAFCLMLTACGTSTGGGGGGGGSIGIVVADNTRVSVHTDETEGDGNSSSPSISADGRYVAFASDSTNLIVGDSNGTTDIFVRDRNTDNNSKFDEAGAVSTVRVSVTSNRIEATGNSTSPAISSDGRYIVFASDSADLIGVGNDSNNSTDIFVHDRDSNGDGTFDQADVSTVRVSIKSDGSQATGGNSTSPSISSDGRYVVFASDSADLIGVGNDSNNSTDIFVHDRDSNGDGTFDQADVSTVRVSIKSDGSQATGGNSTSPSISSNGRYIAFASDSTDLIGGDSNGNTDIFVHDRDTNNDGFDQADISTVRVSIQSDGSQATGGNSTSPSISSNGNHVAFESDAINIVSGDTNGMRDIFIRNLSTGDNTRMSVDKNNTNSDNDSFAPSVNSDGSYVAFESDASDIVSGDTNNAKDIFVNID